MKMYEEMNQAELRIALANIQKQISELKHDGSDESYERMYEAFRELKSEESHVQGLINNHLITNQNQTK
jgi:hypothetical protein